MAFRHVAHNPARDEITAYEAALRRVVFGAVGHALEPTVEPAHLHGIEIDESRWSEVDGAHGAGPIDAVPPRTEDELLRMIRKGRLEWRAGCRSG